MDQRYERSESTILWESQNGSPPSGQGALWPQWSYIKRLARGTEPKAAVRIRLRKTGLDVLTNVEMFEKRSQKTDGLSKRSVNEGKKATKPRAI